MGAWGDWRGSDLWGGRNSNSQVGTDRAQTGENRPETWFASGLRIQVSRVGTGLSLAVVSCKPEWQRPPQKVRNTREVLIAQVGAILRGHSGHWAAAPEPLGQWPGSDSGAGADTDPHLGLRWAGVYSAARALERGIQSGVTRPPPAPPQPADSVSASAAPGPLFPLSSDPSALPSQSSAQFAALVSNAEVRG